MHKSGDKTRRWLIVAIIAACSLYLFPHFAGLNNPNENVRLYMTMAVVDDGTFSIDGPCERFGWVNDRAERSGHLYAGKAPGASMLGVPVYAVVSWLTGGPPSLGVTVRLLRLLVVTLPCLAFLIVLRRFFDEIPGSPWLRDASLLGYGLGSMAFAYSLLYAGHQLAAVCLAGALIAFYAAGSRHDDRQPGVTRRAAAGGLLLGAAPAMEYPAALAAVVIAAYAVAVLRSRPKALLITGLCVLPPVALVAMFHMSAFGSPFAFPYDFIENPAFQRLLHEGWHGATYPRLDRLLAILVAPSFGLLFFTPLLLLAPVGWIAMARTAQSLPAHKRHLSWALPTASIALILYLASSSLWRAGWAVGPRYIASAVPLLSIAALHGAASLATRWPRATSAVVATFVLVAVVHSGSSGALYPHQPESFDNPVYDLNFRLISLGFAPHTALEGLGIVGYHALLVLGLLAVAATIPIAVGPIQPRLAMAVNALIAIGAAVLICVGASAYGETTRDENRMWSLVIRHWEPRGHSAPERRLEEFEAMAEPSLREVRAAAADAELLGRSRQAQDLNRRAARMEREERREQNRPSREQLLLPELGLNPTWGAE